MNPRAAMEAGGKGGWAGSRPSSHSRWGPRQGDALGLGRECRDPPAGTPSPRGRPPFSLPTSLPSLPPPSIRPSISVHSSVHHCFPPQPSRSPLCPSTLQRVSIHPPTRPAPSHLPPSITQQPAHTLSGPHPRAHPAHGDGSSNTYEAPADGPFFAGCWRYLD